MKIPEKRHRNRACERLGHNKYIGKIRRKDNRPISWKDAERGRKISMVLPLLSRRAESKTALARVYCLLLLLQHGRLKAKDASVVVQAAGFAFANLAFLSSAAFLSASLKPIGG